MSEATKKLSQRVLPDGSIEFTFAGFEPIVVQGSDYPTSVREFFFQLGLRTAHRNATIGGDDGSVGTPAEMRERMLNKIAAWKRGELRVATESGERSGIPSAILRAAWIYRAMRAALAAGGQPDNWPDFTEGQPEDLRGQLEGLAEEVTNPAEVEAARAKARAAGAAEDKAAAKAEITRLDQLVATKLFKIAATVVAEEKAAARKAKLTAALSAED